MNRAKQPLPEKAGLEALASMHASPSEQTVRTTFKLSTDVMDVLTLFKQKGMAMKDFMDAVCSSLDPKADEEDSLLRKSLQMIKGGAVETSSSGIRKTLVISKASLHKINKLSQQHRVSRDALVEAAIVEYLLRLSEQREARKEKHKKALDMIRELERQVLSYEEKLEGLLGDRDHDPITSRFGIVIVVIQNLLSAIEEEIEHGTPIDPESY